MADVPTGLAMGSAPWHGETRFLGPRSADRSCRPEPAPWALEVEAHPPKCGSSFFIFYRVSAFLVLFQQG